MSRLVARALAVVEKGASFVGVLEFPPSAAVNLVADETLNAFIGRGWVQTVRRNTSCRLVVLICQSIEVWGLALSAAAEP